jgi:calcineurin-like phosphoesterase family protein
MYILRRDDQALSYSRMRELFIQAFQSFVPEIKKLYLSHYPNATHHTTSDTNMSFIEINIKKTIQIAYPMVETGIESEIVADTKV